MKKIYLLLVLCCLYFSSGAQTKYFSTSTSGGVGVLTNWNTSITGGGTSPADFNNPLDTFVVIQNMSIPAINPWDVAGTVIVNFNPLANSRIQKSDTGVSRMSIGGALIVGGGRNNRITTSFTSTGSIELFLFGDVYVTDSSTINADTIGSAKVHIHFADTSATVSSPKNITWTTVWKDTLNKLTSVVFEAKSVRRLLSDFNWGRKGDIGNTLNGTLICDMYAIDCGYRDSFTISSDATVYTANPGGIDSSFKRMLARNFSGGAHYIYNGTSAQVTGTTLPMNMVAPGTVSVDNSAGVTLTQADSFATGSALKLINGSFINGTLLYMGNGSDVYVDKGTLDASPTYDALVNVTYSNLGNNALAYTTGNELLPTLPATTIGKMIINKPGAVITLGSDVTVVDSVIIDTGMLDASATGNYQITTTGTWANFSGPDEFVAEAGKVTLSGTTAQVLGGTYATKFYDLVLNNSNGAILGTDEQVNNTLTLTSGNVFINTHDLIFGTSASAVAPGTFTNTNMIVANTSGHVRKQYSADGDFLFPVGDSSNYTPIDLNVTAAAYGSADAGVNITKAKHPNNANTNNYLNRYWSVALRDMTSPSYSVIANYVTSDVTGSDALMSMGAYHGMLPWLKYDAANTGTLTLTTGAKAVTDTIVDFTGITTAAPTVVSSPDVRICIPAGAAPLAASSPTGDTVLTYTWSPADGLTATTGMTTVATPSVTTTYTLTITDGNGFTGTAMTTVTVDSTPYLATGVLPDHSSNAYCIGDPMVFTATDPYFVSNYSWDGPVAITTGGTTAVATVAGATLAAAGVYTVTLTNGADSGCIATYVSPTITVDTLPAATVVTTSGGFVFCDTTTIYATNGGDGTMYFQNTVSGGTSTAFPSTSQLINATGTYYFRAQNAAGCWGPESSVTVTINPLPAQYTLTVTLGGVFCEGDTGVHVGMVASDTGISYQLYRSGTAVGSPVMGTGAALDLGLEDTAGSYTVIGTNTTTGCVQDMGNSVDVIINPVPTPYSMTANSGYCVGGSGVDIQLLSSDPLPWIIYELFYTDTATGSVATSTGSILSGTGGTIDYSYFTAPGTYSVVATNTLTGCVNNMATTDSIWINPLPNVFDLLPGGGTACAGLAFFDMKMAPSDTNVNYMLSIDGTPTGISFPGTADTVDFGYQSSPGVYMVTATDANGCVNVMNGSDTIVINPLPFTYPVGGGGAYCVADTIPYNITLAGSDPGIRYQLYNGPTPVGAPMDGVSGALSYGPFTDAGTYMVIATDTTTGCVSPMTGTADITINTLPGVFTIFGGGHYCAGSTGINLWLTASEPGINYLLYADGVYIGNYTGDGSFPFSLGVQTMGGTYTAVAINPYTGCHDTMLSSTDVVVDPLPVVYNMTGGGAYCVSDSTAYPVGLDGSDTGISYQMYRDGGMLGAPLTGTGSALAFGATDTAGTYTIIATNNTTGCVNNMAGTSVVTANVLPLVQTIAGGGSYCAGTGGPTVTLSGSETGVIYQLYVGGLPTGAPLAGSGSSLSFGPQDSAGFYSVVATNLATGCQQNMAGGAIVIIKALPAIWDIAGGGNYCAGDTGRHIFLSGSIVGVTYQLYNGTATVGSPMAGTGAGLDYGLFTSTGTFTIVATNPLGCTAAMAGSVTIAIDALPSVYAISGGDTICSGAPGLPIGLSGSNTGIEYQLYNGTSTVGTPVAGTGSALSFGTFTTAGTYTIVAHNPFTTCVSNMTGTAVIVVNPLPTPFTVTGGGSYCAGGAGVHVGLSGSQVGVTYQLKLGGVSIGGPMLGTGSSLDFGAFTLAGSYTVHAADDITHCVNNMSGSVTVSINPLPLVYGVTGGGTYCVGDTVGLHIGLSNSQSGISYQLYAGSVVSGSAMTGTGSSLDFGNRLPDSTYTVIATNPVTGCTDTMADSAVIAIQNYSIPVVTLTAHPGTTIGVGDNDTVVATVTGGSSPTYQWFVNGNLIVGATNSVFTFTVYFDNDSIVCNVTSGGLCGGITTSKLVVIRLKDVSVKNVLPTTGDVRLIPNPNKGAFSLKGTMGTTTDEDVYVEVTNMLGQVVYKNKVVTKNGVIDEQIQLSGSNANGMYLLNLRSGTHNTVFHFVVEQ